MKTNSVTQNPERLFQEKRFITYVILLVTLVAALMFFDLPWLDWFLENAFISQQK